MSRSLPHAKLFLALGLALSVGSTAGADLPTLSLVQVGGTYGGVQAQPGDTLVLSIQYTIGDGGLTLIDPSLVWDASVQSFNAAASTETGFAAWSGGAVALNPIATGDITEGGHPGLADGWEKATTISGGASSPCVFGACTSLGTASFTLSGQAGVIDFAPSWIPFGTRVEDGNFHYCIPEDPDCWWNGIPFTVIPEPATATLIGLGLVALAAASRNRRH